MPDAMDTVLGLQVCLRVPVAVKEYNLKGRHSTDMRTTVGGRVRAEEALKRQWHGEDKEVTVSADCKLIPSPPARVLRMNIK